MLRRKVLSAELYSITYLFVDGVRFIGVVSDGVRILNIKKKPMKLSSLVIERYGYTMLEQPYLPRSPFTPGNPDRPSTP